MIPNNPPTSPISSFLALLLEFSSPLQVVTNTGYMGLQMWDFGVKLRVRVRLGQLQLLLVGVPAAHQVPLSHQLLHKCPCNFQGELLNILCIKNTQSFLCKTQSLIVLIQAICLQKESQL